jgi:ribulose-phosphate 3-epimerase
MSYYLAPSILSADFGILKEQIQILNSSEADYLHLDIMDGHFVPNLSIGFPVIDAIAKLSEKPLDVHLMVTEPDFIIEKIAFYKPEFITVHYEACTHLFRTVDKIKMLNCKAGVALNPHTPAILLEEIVTVLDLVLIMTVNPGFGGQKFIESTLNKISKTANLISNSGSRAMLEVDGGVTSANISAIANAGANIIVAGNAVFSNQQIVENIHMLKGD